MAKHWHRALPIQNTFTCLIFFHHPKGLGWCMSVCVCVCACACVCTCVRVRVLSQFCCVQLVETL